MATEETCDSCLRGDQETLAKTWCSDCEEKLCESCDKAHRVGKLTFSHQLNELRELPSVPKNTTLESDLCESHQKPLDFFCTFHDVLCCRVCIPASHKACENIEPIDDVCENIKSSALVENISEAVSSLIETTSSVILDRKQNIATIKQQKDKIRGHITSFKSNLTVLLANLEKSLIEQLDTFEDAAISDLENETEKFENISKELHDMKHEFDFNIKYGSNRKLFLLVQMLKQQLLVKDTSVQDTLSQMNNVSLDYIEDSDLSNAVTSLAKVSVGSTAIDIKHKSFIQSSAQSVSKMLAFIPTESMDLSMHGLCSISAIELIGDDKLLLGDFQGKRILLYKDDGTFLQKNEFDHRPYQIAILQDKNQAAITFYAENRIVIVDSLNLNVIKQVDTERSYCGIFRIPDTSKLIVGGTNELEIISEDGTVVRTITVSNNNRDFIRYIHRNNDGTIIYSYSKHVFCIDLLDGTKIFKYTAKNEARGMAQDKNGYIYVASKGQHSIHRITPTGSFVDIALSQNEGLRNPLAIKFSCDGSRFFIGSAECSYLLVFRCK